MHTDGRALILDDAETKAYQAKDLALLAEVDAQIAGMRTARAASGLLPVALLVTAADQLTVLHES